MASRRPPTKRFKPAKIRAKCVSTLGKTTKISFPLKLSSPNAAKSSTCDDISNNITSTYCQISDINDSHEEDDIDVVKKTAYQQRREKQYYFWESIRQSLLNGRIEEEAFLPELEAVCLEITKPHSKPFLVTTIYRPPNATAEFFDHLEKLIKQIDNENKEMYILGDLNCNLLEEKRKHFSICQHKNYILCMNYISYPS